MSLCLAALTPSGIILTADSRQTYRNNAGMTRIGTDNAIKMFKLSDKVGAVIAGRALLPDADGVLKDAGWFIEQFAKQKIPAASVKEIAQKLSEYLTEQLIGPEEKRLTPHISGEVAKEGGTKLVFHPRKGNQLNYSFTGKDGNKVDRQWFIDSIHFIVTGYDADGVGRAYYVYAFPRTLCL